MPIRLYSRRWRLNSVSEYGRKSEIRKNPDARIPRYRPRLTETGSDFGFRISFGFRTSDFGFPLWGASRSKPRLTLHDTKSSCGKMQRVAPKSRLSNGVRSHNPFTTPLPAPDTASAQAMLKVFSMKLSSVLVSLERRSL